jgi:SAM-dependent methyltransferase
MTEKLAALMKARHTEVFKKHGCTPEGLDWGPQEDRFWLRHNNFMKLIADEKSCSLLDVGCGYGAFLEVPSTVKIDFTGIDIVEETVEKAKSRHPEATFICDDFLKRPFLPESFDYVICNGIMTQKLTATIPEMEAYTRAIIRKMFTLCRKGIAFNMMTSRVNFMAPNLFYQNPTEMLSWTMAEISPHLTIDHSYPLYEFMLYVYKESLTPETDVARS